MYGISPKEVAAEENVRLLLQIASSSYSAKTRLPLKGAACVGRRHKVYRGSCEDEKSKIFVYGAGVVFTASP